MIMWARRAGACRVFRLCMRPCVCQSLHPSSCGPLAAPACLPVPRPPACQCPVCPCVTSVCLSACLLARLSVSSLLHACCTGSAAACSNWHILAQPGSCCCCHNFIRRGYMGYDDTHSGQLGSCSRCHNFISRSYMAICILGQLGSCSCCDNYISRSYMSHDYMHTLAARFLSVSLTLWLSGFGVPFRRCCHIIINNIKNINNIRILCPFQEVLPHKNN